MYVLVNTSQDNSIFQIPAKKVLAGIFLSYFIQIIKKRRKSNMSKIDVYKKLDEIIYEKTQKAAYEEQCEQEFVHQEQSNEDYFEGLNDYLDGTMSI